MMPLIMSLNQSINENASNKKFATGNWQLEAKSGMSTLIFFDNEEPLERWATSCTHPY
jgi:hypothetical protein